MTPAWYADGDEVPDFQVPGDADLAGERYVVPQHVLPAIPTCATTSPCGPI